VRILVHSYFPPLHDHNSGGAQQFVGDLLHGLARREHTSIEVICPDPEGHPLADFGPAARITPTLIEPTDDHLTPYERHWNAREVADAAQRSDVILSIDRGLPVEVDVPVVLTLNNFTYATEVEAVFGLAWDEIIVPSRYLQDCVAAVVGEQAWTGPAPPVHLVPYGVDTDHYRPVDATSARERLGLRNERQYVLFPHRPEPSKGLVAALAALRSALEVNPDLHLLVPRPPLSVAAVRQAEQAFIDGVEQKAGEMGLSGHITFHPWVAPSEMPSYYSLGAVCLAVGAFPETFGFTPVQAIACGTPAVATPAGAVEGLLPPGHGLALVAFDDPYATAAALCTPPGQDEVAAGRREIRRLYPVAAAVDTYVTLLGSARRRRGRYRPAHGPLVEAPWVRRQPDGRRWHDYWGGSADGAKDENEGVRQRAGLDVPEYRVAGLPATEVSP
jgi:glycosyltransferase involved in cell wall biosynthesis